jgi:bifunctional DNase/RNase
MKEVVIKALLVDPSNNTPVVLLKDRDSQRAMPIWIGEAEAMAIAFGLQSEEFPRPLTHVLMTRVIEGLKAQVDRVVIKSQDGPTYFASVLLRDIDGEVQEYDARTSDSLALSLRSGCPIFVDDGVFDNSAIESPFADEDEFHEFVEKDLDFDFFRRKLSAERHAETPEEQEPGENEE